MKSALVAALVVALVATASLAEAETDPEEEPCAEQLPELEREFGRSADRETAYRIGRCRERMGDHVGAATIFKRYLAEGGDESPAERRDAAASALVRIETRIGRASVASDVVGVELRIDGQCAVDAATYEPTCASPDRARVIAMNPGQRRLTVKHPAFQDEAYVLTVAAGGNVRVSVNAFAVVEEPNPFRDPMWKAWAVAGGAFVGTTIAGVRTVLQEEGFSGAGGVATIALGAVAVVAAGVATYFTVRARQWKPAAVADALGLRVRF